MIMRRSGWFIITTVVLGLLAASGQAQATLTPLPPGTTVAVSLGTPDALPTGTLIFQATVPYSSPSYDATVKEAVIVDSVTGKLDFLYQVTNTSVAPKNDSISQIATTSFKFVDIQTVASGFGATFSQTAGTYTGAGAIGSITFSVPSATGAGTSPTASRPNTSGFDTVDFFRNPASPLGPGKIGNILILKTNASAIEVGNLAVIDGFSTNGPAPVPAVVPEPTTIALAFSGLPIFGLFWARRRRLQREG
jgi:hypothetical protein